jgi:hypothetical protein
MVMVLLLELPFSMERPSFSNDFVFLPSTLLQTKLRKNWMIVFDGRFSKWINVEQSSIHLLFFGGFGYDLLDNKIKEGRMNNERLFGCYVNSEWVPQSVDK